MPVYLELFHGRKTPGEQLDDWGTQGPILGPLAFVHTTYAQDIKIQTADGHAGVLRVVGEEMPDVLYYDGVYYGDWSVFGPEVLANEWKARVHSFDSGKAIVPAQNQSSPADESRN